MAHPRVKEAPLTTSTPAPLTPAEAAALERYEALIAQRYPPTLAAEMAARYPADAALASGLRRALGPVKKHLTAERLPSTHPLRQAVSMAEGLLARYTGGTAEEG